MSEIKTDKLTGTSTAGSILVTGEGNSTTTNLQQGLAKAWNRFVGGSVPTLLDSLNNSTAIDNGTGDYTFAYTSALQDTTPSAQCTNNTEGNYILVAHATTTTTIQVKSRSDGTAAHDDTSMFTICGDMA